MVLGYWREREREGELLFSAWGVACGRRTAAKTLGKEFKCGNSVRCLVRCPLGGTVVDGW